MNSYIITETGLSMSVDFKPYNIDRTHPKYSEIVAAVKENRFDDAVELYDTASSIEMAGRGRIEVDRDSSCVRYDGVEIHGTLVTRILRMLSEGFDINPLLRFLDNLMQNPSKRAVDELYSFLEYGKMPITEDGHFLAYKRVNANYTSVHDRKTDNSVGNIVEMPRNQVDDRSDNTCSHGLHFCSHEYLSQFSGEKVVVLKINPRDVVSIPTDYNNTKGRACRYEVVGELSPEEVKKALNQGVWDSSVVGDYDDRDIDDQDDATDQDLDDSDLDEWDEGNDGEAEDEDRRAGRIQGYNDGLNGTTKPGDPVIVEEYIENTQCYVDGYLVGWSEGNEDRLKMESAPNDSADYCKGYNDGYRTGRNKGMKAYFTTSDDYAKGYEAGYKDGRGHKPRQDTHCF